MEKMWVVAAIWTMCATCAALFIRGAAPSARRSERKPSRNVGSGDARVRG